MMLKLNILDIKRFLQVLDTCTPRVEIVEADGTRCCPKVTAVQESLRQRFAAAGNYLPLTLHVPDAGDYTKIVCYYVGDC